MSIVAKRSPISVTAELLLSMYKVQHVLVEVKLIAIELVY